MVLRAVGHPEITDVFQTALPTQPRFTESFECVPTHPLLVQTHLFESGSEPPVS